MKTARIVIYPSDPQKALVCTTIGEPRTMPGWRKLHPGDAESSDLWTVMVVPGIEVTARWLHLPTRSEKQALAAARMQMEDELALGTQALHLALGPLEQDGFRLVVSVSREQMQAWLDGARQHGLEPDLLIPDHLTLPEPADAQTLAAQMPDGVAIVRGPRLAFCCDSDLLPMLLKDVTATSTSQPALERMITQGALAPPVNLLQGEFGVRRRGGFLTGNRVRLAVMAGLLLISPVLIQIGQAVHLHISAQRLKAESAVAAASVLPAGAAVQNPVQALQDRFRQLDLTSSGPAGRIALLFSTLEAAGGIQLESLTVMSDGMLQVSLRHPVAEDIDKLGIALAGNGIEMRKVSSREDSGVMVSDVRLGGRP